METTKSGCKGYDFIIAFGHYNRDEIPHRYFLFREAESVSILYT